MSSVEARGRRAGEGRRGGRVGQARRACLALVASCLVCAACRAPEEIDDVAYDERFGEATTLDLYLPEGGGSRPAVLLVHGGAWSFGDKRHFRGWGRRLARSGWVAASVNYRLLPEGVFPRSSRDVACALAFLQARHAEYGIDPERIAVMGYSAGGHLVSLLGVAWDHPELLPDCSAGAPERPAAVIPGAGIQDFRGRRVGVIEDFLGGTESEVPHQYELASPIWHVGPGKPPYLLVVGGADWLADEDRIQLMRGALRSAGNQAEVLLLAGGGHLLNPTTDPGELSFATAIDTPEATLAVVDFLERTLGAP